MIGGSGGTRLKSILCSRVPKKISREALLCILFDEMIIEDCWSQ